MIPFDPLKALREEIAGLVSVHQAIKTRERSAEAQLGEVEAELNALRKLTGFATALIEQKRDALRRLEDAQ